MNPDLPSQLLDELADRIVERLRPEFEALTQGKSGKRVVSCPEAGKELGISSAKVRELVRAQLIRRLPGFEDIRISREALDDFCAIHRRKDQRR